MVTSKSGRAATALIGIVLTLIALSMVVPLIHLLAVSLSDPVYANAKLVYLWPKGFHLNVYKTIIGMEPLWRSMGVTIFITVGGTLLHLFFTSTMAYGLSRPFAPGKKIILRLVLVTFIFSAPLIPTYLVISGLGLENKLIALMLPGAVNAFGVIIMKTFFQGLSSELFDAAKIDGCSELGIFTRIALPLSLAGIATLALFHSVGIWNSYFSALLYIQNKELYPLQILLRSLVVEENASFRQGGAGEVITSTPEMMKAGIILFATAPILLVYPFLQKFFVKGAMLGSLKE
ncbi:putative aldouronate transport system permease protein [Paenibacillus sp. UNCCL117]|uniref:carbohydrate ABC transporter permease n=1 Tax=unclassified Paenibacillus TaxID=185978 RepID=UPI00087E706C|nr:MULTISPECIES: carbohydrate ABC transporter permease [unclassified Paenibacillus]SDC95042.1 putative aldouronate transport system permease protein [Paenibacillus sp. cl123]SFW29934.1 putative aldouronate transport system permease protein [Paenibacillus sp. UNCCL117]